MKNRFIVITLLVWVAAGFACRHETIMPAATVSFQTDVLPILAGNCNQPQCHGGQNPGEAKPLTTYDEVMSDNRIVAGKPHSSPLYKRLIATGSGVMPVSPQPPLTSNQIQIIYIWILQGANNN